MNEKVAEITIITDNDTRFEIKRVLLTYHVMRYNKQGELLNTECLNVTELLKLFCNYL